MTARLEHLRPWVLKRDNYECQYGGPLHEGDLHVDHVWPRALGGTDEMVNLWVLCATCNMGKGARHPMDWIAQTLYADAPHKPSTRNVEQPHNAFWVKVSNACYHAEALGVWVSPDIGLWRVAA